MKETDISVIINTRNEEVNIEDCIKSAFNLTRKVIVVDMESDDKTAMIAKKIGAVVYTFPPSRYVEPARKYAIEKSTSDWVLVIDADERITKELADEIKDSVKRNASRATYFKIPRKNIYGQSKWLQYGGWWPDHQIRLINKKFLVDWPKRIHATPKIKGKMSVLKNPIIHYFHGDLESMVNKTILFEDIESDLLHKAGKKSSVYIFFRKFIAELYRRIFAGKGFMDGVIGIIESIYQAFSKTITYLFLYEKSRRTNMKIGLYDPYLETLGGGEKHILSIIDVFAEMGYEVNIFWDKNLNNQIKNRFPLKYVDRYKYIPNIFTNSNPFKTLMTLNKFDYFFYVTDGSYFASSAKKNYIFSMVPDKKLYDLNLFNRLKLSNFEFISNSPFTTGWLKKWGINPHTIPPYLTIETLNNAMEDKIKNKTILSVARFFPHLHSKNHAAIIKTFQRLKKTNRLFKEYKLILTGGLKDEDRQYFDSLRILVGKDQSIIFKPNVSFRELLKLYGETEFFWHFTGMGVDEKINPEMVEHFGIAPLEAMASGALTFCHNSGGLKEFIKDNQTGFIFKDEQELINKMNLAVKNSGLSGEIVSRAKEMVKKRYNYVVFKHNVLSSIS